MIGRLPALAIAIGVIALPAGALAGRCFPATLVRGSADLYLEKDGTSLFGTMTISDVEALRVCRFEGEWARVEYNFQHLWMRQSDLKLSPEGREALALDLPFNKVGAEPVEMCFEAIVTSKEATLYRGTPDSIEGTEDVIRGSLLMVCNEKEDWVEVQVEDRSGWMQKDGLRISTSQRPRSIGFRQREVCRSFVWNGRVTRETRLVRWEGQNVVSVIDIPEDGTVMASDIDGRWLWVQYGGEWGYVEADAVALEPGMTFAEARYAPVSQCMGEFVRAKADAEPILVLGSVANGNVMVTIPPEAEFAAWPDDHSVGATGEQASWFKASYLGRIGWIDNRLATLVGGRQKMSVQTPSEPVDPSLYREALSPRRSNASALSFDIATGLACSPQLGLTGLGLLADMRVAVHRHVGVRGGLLAAVARDNAIVGPELSVDGRVAIPGLRDASAFIRVALGSHYWTGDHSTWMLGWGTGAGLVVGLSDEIHLGLSYDLRAFHRLGCDEQSCSLESEPELMHLITLSLGLGT